MTARNAIALCFAVGAQALVACTSQPVGAPPAQTGAAPVSPTEVAPAQPAPQPAPAGGSPAQQAVAGAQLQMPACGIGAIDPVDAGTDAGARSSRFLPLPEATTCAVGCVQATSPLTMPLVEAEQVPVPLGGGGMLATRDGKQLIVSDDQRDRLYFVNVDSHALSHVRELSAGEQPGRMAEDKDGRIHVVLRGGGALLSVGRAPDAPLIRRTLCALPRGVAYDATRDLLHVACAEGQLVSVPAEPSAAVTRTLELERDLRDVIVRDDSLLVTRFRSAELLRVDADGKLKERLLPPVAHITNQRDPKTSAALPDTTSSPDLAWRAIDVPGKGSALLHQRARDGQVAVQTGGYASTGCSGLVQTSLTIGLDGPRTLTADLADSTLAIDMAVDPTGNLLAVISPGNWSTLDQIRVYSLTGTSALNPLVPAELQANASPGFVSFVPGVTAVSDRRCLGASTRYPAPAEPLGAVAWTQGPYGPELAVFERESAAISFIHAASGQGLARTSLGQDRRFDTGNALFHLRTSAGLACASCHGEVGDDGHVWMFEGLGPRRTQSLRGGIIGTEPLHWGGEMPDFDTLVHEVLGKRMQGPELAMDQENALLHFIDRQPRLVVPARDEAQAQRGQTLFESAAVGCSGCHAGKLLTDNRSLDVGTGEVLQVPALRNVSFRLPLMHNGCATTLRQRFDAACGGGDHHGDTSQLSPADLDDLIAYLETL